LSGLTAVCIGEKTAEAAKLLGMRVIQSKEKTIESMAEAME
jgi:uroporphyrinogen-III synthase